MPSILRKASRVLQNAGRSAQRSLSTITPTPALPESIRPVIWILKQAGQCVKKNAQYYYAHPREAYADLTTYAKENPKEFTFMCVLIIAGILMIALPPALGFGSAGIGLGALLGSVAAGWQAGIGSVVAGSLFATLTSMGMTGAFVAIGSSMIVLGFQTPLLGWLLRRLKSLMADASAGISELGILPNLPMLQRVLRSTAPADSIVRSTDRSPGPRWFLDPRHTNVKGGPSASEGSSTGHIDKRIIITNSKEAYRMVWEDLDVPTNNRTIKEHAVFGFDVMIQLVRPQRKRGEDGFCETFTDHETDCRGDCWCIGDIKDVRF